jgi:hypothetical protein
MFLPGQQVSHPRAHHPQPEDADVDSFHGVFSPKMDPLILNYPLNFDKYMITAAMSKSF